MNAEVLIIEDVKEMSDLVAMYLGKEGMTVQCVESAEDAFSILEKFSPDIVILDLNLLGMDGFEFIEKLREIDEYKNIQAGDSHGDIIVWPIKALAQYIEKTNEKIVYSKGLPCAIEKIEKRAKMRYS